MDPARNPPRPEAVRPSQREGEVLSHAPTGQLYDSPNGAALTESPSKTLGPPRWGFAILFPPQPRAPPWAVIGLPRWGEVVEQNLRDPERYQPSSVDRPGNARRLPCPTLTLAYA